MGISPKDRQKPRFVVGIDEVGRGPLAGPVAVGAVCVPAGSRARVRRAFRGIRDSKKLSPLAREKWASLIRHEAEAGSIAYCVSFASSGQVDRRGVANVIRSLVARCLRRLAADPAECEVLLDGALRAPTAFVRQRTIVRGDDSVMEISMASVAAKVARDRRMVALSRRFPGYGFEVHMGYGTASHIGALRARGASPVHRMSFIGGVLDPKP